MITATCGCALERYQVPCYIGRHSWHDADDLMRMATDPEIFGVLDEEGRKQHWEKFNQATNEYLTHVGFSLPPTDLSKKPAEYVGEPRYCPVCKKETIPLMYNMNGGTVLGCVLCKDKEELFSAILSFKYRFAKQYIKERDYPYDTPYHCITYWIGQYNTYKMLAQRLSANHQIADHPLMHFWFEQFLAILEADHAHPYTPPAR